MQWKTLPLEGHRLKKIAIFGNGKDSELTLEAKEEDLPRYCITVRDPTFTVEIDGKLRTEIFNDGADTCLGVRYLPREELLFETCRIEDVPAIEDPELFGYSPEDERPDRHGVVHLNWLVGYAEIRVIRIEGKPRS